MFNLEEFIRLSRNSEKEILMIQVKSRQSSAGYIGIGAFKKPNEFENSFQVIAYTDSMLIQLTNHTQIVTKTIFNEEFDKPLYNRIDGILSFNFYINISEVNGKDYFYFAQNENQIPVKTNETFFIPNHKITSEVLYFPLNSTGFLPECNAELNSPGRLLSQNWRIFIPTSLFYFFVAFLMLLFKDEQPLKSRFVGPLFMLFGVYVNLIGEFIPSLTTFEETSKFYCEITAYLVYLSLQIGFTIDLLTSRLTIPTIIVLRYFLLLRIHEQKKLAVLKMEEEEIDIGRCGKLNPMIMRFIKLISNKYFILILPPLWAFVFAILMTIIYGINEFKCSITTTFALRMGHLICMFIFIISVTILILIDFLWNLKNIFTCKWRKYLIEDDPYHFRVDVLTIIPIVPLAMVWAFVPLPYLFKGIIVDLIIFQGILVNGGVALGITIFKFIYYKYKRIIQSNKLEYKKLLLDDVFSNQDLSMLFGRFCDLEWSSENYLFRLDVEKYIKSNLKDRKILVKFMKTRYLEFSKSPLELNVLESEIFEFNKKIEKGEYPDDLFRNLMKTVNLNLLDSLSRFSFSSLYESHLTSEREKQKTLGL
jgi:hypothetical protein